MSDAAITLWLDGALRCVLVFPPDHQELAVQVIDGDHAVVTEPCTNPDAAALVAQELWTTHVEARPMPRHLRAVRMGPSTANRL
jgi:hypothetical protein